MRVKVSRIYVSAAERQALADIDAGLAIVQHVLEDYCQGLTTEQLQRICRIHAHSRNADLIPFDFLLAVMAELARRRKQEDAWIDQAAAEWNEAWLQAVERRANEMPDHEFSPEFERKMIALIRQHS